MSEAKEVMETIREDLRIKERRELVRRVWDAAIESVAPGQEATWYWYLTRTLDDFLKEQQL